MKIFHTSDWHLGRMLYGRSLLEDQAHLLEQTLAPLLEAEQPDLLIIAGDIYDRQVPPIEAIRLFDRFLARMAAANIAVAFIAGNHDGPERIALLKNLLRQNGIAIATDLEDAQAPLILEKDGRRVQVFLLPYLDSSVVRDYFQDDSLKGEAACMRRVLAHLQTQFEEHSSKILVAHCFAAGAETSDSESGMWVGGSGAVPPELWADFDYVALGHLHRAQKAGVNARYSGSPLKYSVDEQTHKKSIVKLLWTEEGLQTELIPFVPLREVRRVSGLFAELIEAAKATGSTCDDYVEIELCDENPVLLAAERLREYYPNLLAVTNRWVAQATAHQENQTQQKRDDITIFKSFLSEICGLETNELEENWFHQIKGESEADAK